MLDRLEGGEVVINSRRVLREEEQGMEGTEESME